MVCVCRPGGRAGGGGSRCSDRPRIAERQVDRAAPCFRGWNRRWSTRRLLLWYERPSKPSSSVANWPGCARIGVSTVRCGSANCGR